ncbi:PREDICTED: zinc finger B-box domain-containing protein 1 [Chaetura pelagica]|uniref:zinc finger B-box domain-containing protein 1 n=1 Tax=Chaetura pelagica TaxID=8897 RepID=UPI00052333B4|nr:PREDICTED: zinc finger B-box domain-containing protein 1 [Chaetura pelagica]
MNINDFVTLPGSKNGTSTRFKVKTVRELQLEKAQLERETKEMEKKLRQLQLNMSREKEQRKKSSAYHWKSGPMTMQTQVLLQLKENNNKVSSGKVRLQILKEHVQEPVKKPFKHEMAKAVAHEKSKVKEMACGVCEIKSALLTEADTHVARLEAVDHFIKEVNLNKLKVSHEQKKVNSKHQVTTDKFSSRLLSVDSAEELPSESTCTDLENQDKGLLLNGTFNEEESAQFFQEALLQWRKGNGDHREQLHPSNVLPESVGICEVQTNLIVLKEPVQIEFKKGGLSYMEKLLLKKYRRAAIDEASGSCVKDLRPVETLSVHQAVIESGEEGDDDIDELTAEEVRRYWTSVFREEVPDTVSERAESSLKIEFLDDYYDKDLEESSNFLVIEAEMNGKEMNMGMNKEGKNEPPEQFERNPISSEEISQEKVVVCSHLERNAVQKESDELQTVRELPEKISNPSELMSNKFLLETQLQKIHKDSQELDSVCNNQSLVLPVITKHSVLQDVAKRQKSASTQYWGLEGFFVGGASPKQLMPEARSLLCADSTPVDSDIPFPGNGRWVTERSLSENADDSVVQGVLEGQLMRPSSGLEIQNRISAPMLAQRSCPGNNSRRPWSTDALNCKQTGNCPTNIQARPKSSSVHVCEVDAEVPRHKCLDRTKQGVRLWECIADQEALLALEKELQSCTGPENYYSLTTEDVNSSSRHSEKICRHTTDFHKNLELKGHSRADTLKGWDESQMDDEEEILEDKQQVLALH